MGQEILYTYVCIHMTLLLCVNYRIPGNFRGMYISRLSNQSGFSRMRA